MKKSLLVVVVAALILSSMSIFALAASKVGCSNCHVGQYSLNNGIKNLAKHPNTKADSYDACLPCHKSGKLAFGPILHKYHLVGDNHFMSNYGGDCRACHVLDANAGTFSIAK